MSSSSLLWGRDHEYHARDQYVKGLPDGLSVKECGLHISEINGFLGASPDGLVFNGDQLCGCIEIKCPFSAREKSIADACSQSQFFCKRDSSNKISLKRTHNYYYQVQGQLAVLNLPWCDFVVWTNRDFCVERVNYDEEFWSKQCLPKL